MLKEIERKAMADDICKFINLIRGLDEEGAILVSTMIAGGLESDRKKRQRILTRIK